MGRQAGGLWPLGVQKGRGGQPPLLAAHLLHTPRRRHHMQVSGYAINLNSFGLFYRLMDGTELNVVAANIPHT